MEESDADMCKIMLELHLGALHSSYPADLSLTQSSKGSGCGAISFSARCFVPEDLQRRGIRGSEVDRAGSSLSAAGSSSGDASGPVREVFCRVLPQPPVLPAADTIMVALKTAKLHDGDGSVGTLPEALGLMYGGVHVVYSGQPSTIGAAGPGARREEGGTAEEKATRAPSSTPRLVPCTRLHAGLIPLYAPIVESTDGIFLVRLLPGLDIASWGDIS